MKLKKMLSALVASALCMSSFSAISVDAAEYTAYIAGAVGANQLWSPSEVTGNSKAPVIDGNGQFEAVWYVTTPSSTCEFLMLVVPGLGSEEYPDLAITIDEFAVDGEALADYSQSEGSCDFAYLSDGELQSRVYFNGSWAGSRTMDIPETLNVDSHISVKFTVSGLPNDSASATVPDDSQSESESESVSESLSEAESESQSEAESTSQPESESESEPISESESESQSETSESSAANDSSADDEEDGGGFKTWMILVGVAGVAAIVAIIIVIIKIRNKRYYL